MNFERSIQRRNNLNLTPLIDVIFLLIVFFLLTSNYVNTKSVNLSLAGEDNIDKLSLPAKEELVMVELFADDKYQIKDEKDDIANLSNAVENLLKEDKLKDFILVTKKQVSVEHIVKAMDEITLAGGKNIYLSQKQ